MREWRRQRRQEGKTKGEERGEERRKDTRQTDMTLDKLPPPNPLNPPNSPSPSPAPDPDPTDSTNPPGAVCALASCIPISTPSHGRPGPSSSGTVISVSTDARLSLPVLDSDSPLSPSSSPTASSPTRITDAPPRGFPSERFSPGPSHAPSVCGPRSRCGHAIPLTGLPPTRSQIQ